MTSAKGQVLSEIAIKWQKNNSPQNKERVARAFTILGKETANFHKLSAKPTKNKLLGNTMAHGDYHLKNLFFDDINGHFTLIDNETMALYSKKPVDPSIDLCKPFYISFNTTFEEFEMIITGIDFKTWYSTTLKNFIIGYIGTYPAQQQLQVLNELKKIFLDFNIPEWVHCYEKETIKKDYIRPIFDQLIKEKGLK